MNLVASPSEAVSLISSYLWGKNTECYQQVVCTNYLPLIALPLILFKLPGVAEDLVVAVSYMDAPVLIDALMAFQWCFRIPSVSTVIPDAIILLRLDALCRANPKSEYAFITTSTQWFTGFISKFDISPFLSMPVSFG